MTKCKVRLRGSDGAEYVITYEGLWRKLRECMNYNEKIGWNNITRSLRDDFERLRDVILSEVLIPKAKEAVITFLKSNPDIETRSFVHKAWSHGERLLAWYKAKKELEADGVIMSQSHGKGHNRTWRVKEDST